MGRGLVREWRIALLLACVAAPVAGQKAHTVGVNPDLTFTPAQLTIGAGDTVTWVNNGGLHNVRADDGAFRCASGCDGGGGDGNPSESAWSFTLTFDAPGESLYFCEVHGAAGRVGMSGVVIVEPVDDGGGGGGGGGDDEDPPEETEEPPDVDDPVDSGGEADPEDEPVEERRPALPTRFVSGFEVTGFDDWDLRSCDSCQLERGTVAAGALAVAPARTADGAGDLVAWLASSAGADLDLYLSRWSGGRWVRVAAAATPGPTERVRVPTDAAEYRWEVQSNGEAGTFSLLFGRLGEAASSRLEQTSEARRMGSLGASSVYEAGSSASDYLIDLLPLPATAYTASFHVQALDGTKPRGRRGRIFLLIDGEKPILRLKLGKPGSARGVRLVASVKTDGRWSPNGSTFVRFDSWRRVALSWRAASTPTSADGYVELRRGPDVEWRLDGLDNHGQRVSEVWFGLLAGSGERTEGRLYLDDFVSEWEF